jgi:hypothetical protein
MVSDMVSDPDGKVVYKYNRTSNVFEPIGEWG